MYSIIQSTKTGRGFLHQLFLLFCEKKDLTIAWRSSDEVEWFPYWNNTDKPDDLTDEQWDERGRIWDAAIKPYRPPSECSINANLSYAHGLDNGLTDTKDNIETVLPDMKVRTSRIANDQLFEEYKKNSDEEVTSGNIIRHFMKYTDWCKGDGKQELEQRMKKIEEQLVKTITKDDLLKSLEEILPSLDK
ncbi:MAG: hypothetical protein WDZ68_01660 [Candidatus Paceibacterota bacterium]